MQKNTLHNKEFDLEKEAPTLNSIKQNKENSLKTPKGYFEEFPTFISSKLKTKPNFAWFRLKWAIPSLAVVLFGILFVFNEPKQATKEVSTNEIYYAILEDNNEHLDLAINFETSTVNYEELDYLEYEGFNYDLPIETENIDLNILFE